MGQIDHKDYIIDDDGTIIRISPDERIRKEKIEKLKQRISGQKSYSHIHSSPHQLLEEARKLFYYGPNKEEEAMALFYRPDVQSLMSADDCFSAGEYMFRARHDASEARRWYQRAGEIGGMDAQLRIAHMLSYGEDGMPEDVNAALAIYANGVAQCNPKAEEKMGDIYMYGYLNVEINYTKAEEMYRRSAAHGNKFTDYPLNKLTRLNNLKKLASERLVMQIDNATTSSRGVRVSGRVDYGNIQEGDYVYIVDKKTHIYIPSQIDKAIKKQSAITEIEIISMEIKEPHGNKGIPGDYVRVLLRGVTSKDVEIGDYIVGM